MATTTATREEVVARRPLARSAMYQLLSQGFVYPSQEVVAALGDIDLPQAELATVDLTHPVSPLLKAFGEHLRTAEAGQLQAEHRRVFTHVLTLDCPPCETFYTARHVFQETQDLSDIGGFYRAFGLEVGEKERLDHVSVELEFMHFLAYKEGYALTHHGPAKARLCRDAQRKFVQEHLGRWAPRFAERLADKANGGYYGCLASLMKAFLDGDIAFLKAHPDAVAVSPNWRTETPQDFSCPVGGDCPQ